MREFSEFMKNPANRIGMDSQYTEGIEGYVFNGADESQMAFWTHYEDRDTKEHTHSYDEYFVVVHGQYTAIVNGREELLRAGQECHIPKGTPHSGKAVAGTRTIQCFGGKRI